MARIAHIRKAVLGSIRSETTQLTIAEIVKRVEPKVLGKKGSPYWNDGGTAVTLKGDTQRALTWLSNAGYMRHYGPRHGGYWRITKEGLHAELPQ